MSAELLQRLPSGTRYISRDGRWLIGEPPMGTGWMVRPVDYDDLRWWVDQDYPNHYRTLAQAAVFLRSTFREDTHPGQSLSSLVIDQGNIEREGAREC